MTAQKQTARTPPDIIETYSDDAPAMLQNALSAYFSTDDQHGNNPYWIAVREYFFACFRNTKEINDFILNGTLPPRAREAIQDDAEAESVVSACADDMRWHEQKHLSPRINGPLKTTSPLRGVDQVTNSIGGSIHLALPFELPVAGNQKAQYVAQFAQAAVPLTNGLHALRGYTILSRLYGTDPWTEEKIADRCLTNISAISKAMPKHHWLAQSTTPNTHVFLHTPPELGPERLFYYRTYFLKEPDAKKGSYNLSRQFSQTSRHKIPPFIDMGIIAAHDHAAAGYRPTKTHDLYLPDRHSRMLFCEFGYAIATDRYGDAKAINRWHVHHTLRRMRMACTPLPDPIDPMIH
jgi:hypothetical protein